MHGKRTRCTKVYKIKFWLLQQKAYFDKGSDILNLLKYGLAAMGIFAGSKSQIIFYAVSFVIVSYIVGLLWWKNRLAEIELEVYNKINPFVKEMRNSVYRKS